MTPLERAAAIIEHAILTAMPIAGVPDGKAIACAVLRAIREPSEAMLGACDNIALESDQSDAWLAERFWQVMIDAALQES